MNLFKSIADFSDILLGLVGLLVLVSATKMNNEKLNHFKDKFFVFVDRTIYKYHNSTTSTNLKYGLRISVLSWIASLIGLFLFSEFDFSDHLRFCLLLSTILTIVFVLTLHPFKILEYANTKEAFIVSLVPLMAYIIGFEPIQVESFDKYAIYHPQYLKDAVCLSFVFYFTLFLFPVILGCSFGWAIYLITASLSWVFKKYLALSREHFFGYLNTTGVILTILILCYKCYNFII